MWSLSSRSIHFSRIFLVPILSWMDLGTEVIFTPLQNAPPIQQRSVPATYAIVAPVKRIEYNNNVAHHNGAIAWHATVEQWCARLRNASSMEHHTTGMASRWSNLVSRLTDGMLPEQLHLRYHTTGMAYHVIAMTTHHLVYHPTAMVFQIRINLIMFV